MYSYVIITGGEWSHFKGIIIEDMGDKCLVHVYAVGDIEIDKSLLKERD
jgi:hypothetical protein